MSTNFLVNKKKKFGQISLPCIHDPAYTQQNQHNLSVHNYSLVVSNAV